MKRFIKRKLKHKLKRNRVLKNPLFFSIITCKFCYGLSHAGEKLYNVCECDGSLKWCHKDCLYEWIKYKYYDKSKCDICATSYVIPDLPPAKSFIIKI